MVQMISTVLSSSYVEVGTPPNPSALLPGVTYKPLIGTTWDPVIDHTTFLPGAFIDIFVVSLVPGAVNAPTPLGTLLCDISGTLPFFTAAPGVPFAIPIPSNCNLAGLQLCTQGASGDASTIALTNGLDITIGTF